MGGCSGRNLRVTPIDVEAYMQSRRLLDGGKFLILAVRDTNWPGPSGSVGVCIPTDDQALLLELDDVMRESCPDAVRQTEIDNSMYDAMYRHTQLTTGNRFFPQWGTPIWFPRGRIVVRMLDVLARNGWVSFDGPNFGGPLGEKVDFSWPVFMFSRDEQDIYTTDNLFVAIKDQGFIGNYQGQVCVAGPSSALEELETTITPLFSREVTIEKGDSDGDWDLVWTGTNLTSGLTFTGVSYFPKGRELHKVLTGFYALGWRLVGAPNFGGDEYDWPCLIFRRLKTKVVAPNLLIVGVKDQCIPGKVCLAGGEDTAEAASEMLKKLAFVPGNNNAFLEEPGSDEDWPSVLRKTKITTGAAMFSMRLAYFPRNDAVIAMLQSLGGLGWAVVSCPNFSGRTDAWPTFILERRKSPVTHGLVAIKDQNYPGKVCIGGPYEAAEALLSGFKKVNGDRVEQVKDDYDQTFDVCYKNTTMTCGGQVCPLIEKPWFPYGYPLEMLMHELQKVGWTVVGGPNFGSGRLSWPTLILVRNQ